MTPELVYNKHPFKALRYFEWVAIERLYAKQLGERMYNLYPDVVFSFWADAHTKFSAEVKRNPKSKMLGLSQTWTRSDQTES